jgi:hypothetical protein
MSASVRQDTASRSHQGILPPARQELRAGPVLRHGAAEGGRGTARRDGGEGFGMAGDSSPRPSLAITPEAKRILPPGRVGERAGWVTAAAGTLLPAILRERLSLGTALRRPRP